MTRRRAKQPAKGRERSFAWRQSVVEGLQAANAVVRRLTPRAGQRVVAGREEGYRSW
ncbi:MAG: hypothetical protein HY803_16540, partial [candidate division NC10 bacterium]|nr:hypothetical protein [candidate division NC10 bacterium]